MAKRSVRKGSGLKKPASPDEKRSAILEAISSAMRELRGGMEAACGADVASLVFGIEAPLPFQILIQNNVIPFGRCIVLVGDEGVGKTALLFEIGRWFFKSNGFLYFLENESKFDPLWANSIIGYEDEAGTRIYDYYQTSSVEDWQSVLMVLLEKIKEAMSDRSGPGKTIPILFGLDSIAGKLSAGTAAKIAEDGFAGRSAPMEAMSITKFMKKLTSEMGGWPFGFCGVNHEKTNVEMGFGSGSNRVYRPGGKHMDYQEAIEIRLSTPGKSGKIEKIDEDKRILHYGGQRIKMMVRKNSEGESYRELNVPIIWRYRKHPRTGEIRQYTAWDWWTAIVELLMSCKREARNKLLNILDLEKENRGYTCTRLGIRKPVDERQMGEAIMSTPEVVSDLQDFFAVFRRRVFRPGVDYDEQRRQALEEARKLREQLIEEKLRQESGKGSSDGSRK